MKKSRKQCWDIFSALERQKFVQKRHFGRQVPKFYFMAFLYHNISGKMPNLAENVKFGIFLKEKQPETI